MNKIKICSLLLVAVILIDNMIAPIANAVTIEEQVGNKAEKTTQPKQEYNDEFSSKAPVRRDSATPVQERDPRLACLLSLVIPGGGGHIYLRQDIKGISFFVISMASYSLAGYYFYEGFFKSDSVTTMKAQLLISGLFFIVGLIVHTVGIVEAYNDAVEINEKRYYYGEIDSEEQFSPYVAKICIE